MSSFLNYDIYNREQTELYESGVFNCIYAMKRWPGVCPAIFLYRHIYLRDDLWNGNAVDIRESHVAAVVAIGQLRVVHSQ